MTILIGRYAGHVTFTSTSTGRIAAASDDEWAAFVERVKSGHLDHTLKPSKVLGDKTGLRAVQGDAR